MTLPEYKESKYALLKERKYTFRIIDEPEKHRFGKATGIILRFTAFSMETDEMKDSSSILWPWTEEYKILKEEIINSDQERDWPGKTFIGEIVHVDHPTKPGQKIQNIINIEPFYPEETKEEPEPEPEVEDTTVTPPKEGEDKDTTPPPPEKGDPGPGEKDAPPEEEEEKQDGPTKEDKPSREDEEATNKKDFPKKDDEKGGPPW